MDLRREADQVRELADGLEISERRQPLEPQRVEVVAGEQRQVGVRSNDDSPTRVVQQVALAHGLEHERVFARGAGGALAGRGQLAQHGFGAVGVRDVPG